MIEMNKEFRTYATDTGTQDLHEHITEYKHWKHCNNHLIKNVIHLDKLHKAGETNK